MYIRRCVSGLCFTVYCTYKEGIVINKMQDEILIQKAKMKSSDEFTELMKSQMQKLWHKAFAEIGSTICYVVLNYCYFWTKAV